MKRAFSMILALFFALTMTAPGFAIETDPGREPFPTPEATETTQPEPYESPIPQESALPGEILGETELPVESQPQEMDEIPTPEETSMPEESEFPDNELPDDDLSVINVTVPKTGWVIINPYGLPVDTGSGTSREQIVGEPMVITNQGEAPVTVWVSAVGRIADLSGMVLVTEPPRVDAQEKEIFLYAEFKDGESPWSGSYHSAENQLLITDQASEPKDVLMLDGGEAGWFQLFGATAVDTGEDWSEDDVIRVTITFTFTSEETLNTELEMDPAPLPEDELPKAEPEAAEEPAIDQEPELTEGPEPEAAPEATEGPDSGLDAMEEPEAEPTLEFTDGPTPDPDPETVDEPMLEPVPEGTD